MTEVAPTYEPDLIFSRVAEARANAETLRLAANDAARSIDELSRLVEHYRLQERAREVRGE
jgi:hypothetical protein